jgi:mRNA-degrading endonuclease RelE of RelBE toxin-antitoxin system
MFTIDLSPDAERRLAVMAPVPKQRIRQALRTLEQEGDSGKALELDLAGYRRLAVGDYRIIYRLHHRTVTVRTIRPRRVVYEELSAELKGLAGERRIRWRRLRGPVTRRLPR